MNPAVSVESGGESGVAVGGEAQRDVGNRWHGAVWLEHDSGGRSCAATEEGGNRSRAERRRQQEAPTRQQICGGGAVGGPEEASKLGDDDGGRPCGGWQRRQLAPLRSMAAAASSDEPAHAVQVLPLRPRGLPLCLPAPLTPPAPPPPPRRPSVTSMRLATQRTARTRAHTGTNDDHLIFFCLVKS
ncbi:hypothetical protein GUJ93_ZPchr0007g3420 [Zizania palustris]|uniref:Uncharacterized protein n=1 Tax=Zizania palustris TaxID=103762 RepID=A0A8J5SQN0_ZIZPA|nr:hypothetical protein GUJ93_ZPchr0007g3420 [Zizania palustris]